LRPPKRLLGVCAALSLAALIILPRLAADPFEYDFRKLRSEHSASARGEARWYAANAEVFAGR